MENCAGILQRLRSKMLSSNLIQAETFRGPIPLAGFRFSELMLSVATSQNLRPPGTPDMWAGLGTGQVNQGDQGVPGVSIAPLSEKFK